MVSISPGKKTVVVVISLAAIVVVVVASPIFLERWERAAAEEFHLKRMVAGTQAEQAESMMVLAKMRSRRLMDPLLGRLCEQRSPPGTDFLSRLGIDFGGGSSVASERAAVAELGAVAIRPLVVALSSDEENRRAWAAELLVVELDFPPGEQEARTLYRRLLESGPAGTRAAVAVALATLGASSTVRSCGRLRGSLPRERP